jgi:hypothetical protein
LGGLYLNPAKPRLISPRGKALGFKAYTSMLGASVGSRRRGFRLSYGQVVVSEARP